MGGYNNSTEYIPRLSIVMASHRADAYMAEAIESCLSQTFADFELVVVCNGPQAEEIAQAAAVFANGDPRVRIFQTRIKHLPFSLSLGLHHARAPLVARMDADDISMPDRLERQVNYMNAHPEVAVLGTQYDVINANGDVLQRVTLPLDDALIRSTLRRTNPFCHPSVIYRKATIEGVGGYLGGLHAEDFDLWIRISELPDVKLANLPDVCLRYRQFGASGARRSRLAYSTVAASQWAAFVRGRGVFWLFAALYSTVKGWVRSSRII